MRIALLAGLMAAIVSPAAAQLTDPGFEDPATLTFDGPPFLGSWEGFNGADASAAFTTTNPNNGASSLEINLLAGSTFAGAFQDVAVAEGDEVVWSGFHALGSGSTPGGTEVRIEWADAAGAAFGATPNFEPILTADDIYVPYSVTGTAPAGAAFARLVYAGESFTVAAPQTIFVDDVSVSITPAIPEPTALGLVTLAGLAMVARRRNG